MGIPRDSRALVIGWSQTPPTYNKHGDLRQAQGWEAWVLHDHRVHRVGWMTMRSQLTLEGREALR